MTLDNFFTEEKVQLQKGQDLYSIESLAKNEWLEFAKYSIESRAIPNMIDGQKPVQRFYLYSSIENTKTDFKKVSAVAGVLSGCVVGDTQILMGDGNQVSIENLMDEDEDEISVISCSETLQLENDTGFNVRISKYVNETFLIELEDGKFLECTPEHQIAVYTDEKISYKMAKDLNETDNILAVNISKI